VLYLRFRSSIGTCMNDFKVKTACVKFFKTIGARVKVF